MYEYTSPDIGKLNESIHEMLEDWNTFNWNQEAKVAETTYRPPVHSSKTLSVPDKAQFMRHVSQNLPLVIRGAAKDWACVRQWSKEYLVEKMGKQEVKVAITPDG
jgi:hypothetical protein